MRKYLIMILCTIILIISVFALPIINANAKTEDLKEEKYSTKKDLIIEKEVLKESIESLEKEVEDSSIIQTSPTIVLVQNNTPVTENIVYGTFGRLYVSGYSVALYDYNVHTESGSSLQAIVDNYDSAAYYYNNGKLIIADHYYQGFSVLANLSEGTTSYIQLADGSIIRYTLIKKSQGYNTGPDLIDLEGNSFFDMNSDIIMYTCYGDGIMATLWVLA